MNRRDTEARKKAPLSAVIAVDCVSAVAASVAVSPFVAIIDQAVGASAAGAKTLTKALKENLAELFLRPTQFARNPTFLLMCGVYSGTYAAANIADSVSDRVKQNASTPTVVAAAIARGLPKFISSSGANMTLAIYKDIYIARMYSSGPPAPLPLMAFSMFAARDLVTMASSFTLPAQFSIYLHEEQGWSRERSQLFAQLSLPVAFTAVTCPMHLMGLNYINAPNATLPERMSFLKEKVVGSSPSEASEFSPRLVGRRTNTKLKAFGYRMVDQFFGSTVNVNVTLNT
ncbi:unnamed protein product, partial [Heterosigma akashiwo]